MVDHDEHIVEQIKKNIRKRNRDWSEEQITSAAEGVLGQYMEKNKDMLEKRKEEDRKSLEHSLDMEYLNLWLDWQENERKKHTNPDL